MVRGPLVRSLLIIFSIASAANAQLPPPASQILTLQDSIRVALEKNPTVQAAAAYCQAVREGIAEAKAARMPRANFIEGFTRSNNPVYVFGTLLTQHRFNASDFALNFLITPQPLDNFRTQFSAAVPLYDGGQLGRRIKDARLSAQGARETAQRTRQEVIFHVIKAQLL